MDFVNALAFSKGEMLKHLQDFFVNFTNVNALARARIEAIRNTFTLWVLVCHFVTLRFYEVEKHFT